MRCQVLKYLMNRHHIQFWREKKKYLWYGSNLAPVIRRFKKLFWYIILLFWFLYQSSNKLYFSQCVYFIHLHSLEVIGNWSEAIFITYPKSVKKVNFSDLCLMEWEKESNILNNNFVCNSIVLDRCISDVNILFV